MSAHIDVTMPDYGFRAAATIMSTAAKISVDMPEAGTTGGPTVITNKRDNDRSVVRTRRSSERDLLVTSNALRGDDTTRAAHQAAPSVSQHKVTPSTVIATSAKIASINIFKAGSDVAGLWRGASISSLAQDL